MWIPTPTTADVTDTKIGRLRSRPHSDDSVIFSYFWHSYILTYGQFVEYMNMHTAGCWLDKTVWVSPLHLIGDGRLCMQLIDAGGLCGRIRLCTHGVTTVGGVTAGHARHN